LEAAMVIMPRRWTDDGRGVYGEATLFLAKELRAEAIDVEYLEPSADRLFEVKKSTLLTALASIGIGIGSGVGSNAAWAGIKRLLSRDTDDDREIEISYVDLSESGDCTQYTIRGPVREVIEAVEELRDRPSRRDPHSDSNVGNRDCTEPRQT
jgi:hypothetical protein